MPITLLISQHKDQRRCLYLKDDHVLDAELEWPRSKTLNFSYLDQIYWGRAIHVESSHVFVKLTDNQVGLLPLEHPFSKPHEGQAVLVQVRREAIPDKGTRHKGPVLTQKITFAGRYCLFHPFHPKRLISSKIQDVRVRNHLQGHFPAHEPITLRESAAYASFEQIQTEIESLRRKYNEIVSLADRTPCSTPYDAMPSSQRWMRDMDLLEDNRILVDDDKCHTEIRTFLKAHRPDLLPQLQKVKEPLFAAYNLEDFWDSLFQDVVALPSRGNIVIDVTAAATVIDVNQGDKDARETNKEAIPVIVQQLKGRHLGGNIIIDFMGLDDPPLTRDSLKDLIIRQAAVYNLPLDVFGWSKLGWMEARLPKRRVPIGDRGV